MLKKDKIMQLKNIIQDFVNYQKNSVPLCAAENPCSNFCKLPLSGDFQERYIVGNYDTYNIQDNFIGSEFLQPFYKLLQLECETLFQAKYSDARTLSGMNCITALLMALTQINDKIAVLSNGWGGHPSMVPICERLGLLPIDLPYDITHYDLDYVTVNKIIKEQKIPYILIAPSDIIVPFDIKKLDLSNTILIYDISQIMGLIAAKQIENPLTISENIIMIGGTHKTFPGPTSGLILTNNQKLHERINEKINPIFLRNPQMHQIVSLLFALLEFEYYGKDYSSQIVKTANYIGANLEKHGMIIAKKANTYTETHQIFWKTTKEEMDLIWKNAIKYGISLNKKNKKLFAGYGIRLGSQEIARYQWNEEALNILCDILLELTKAKENTAYIHQLMLSLPSKKIAYTFPNYIVEDFKNILS